MIVFAGIALGMIFLRAFNLVGLSNLERNIFGIALGLSIIAYSIFSLGITSFLSLWALAGFLLVLSLITIKKFANNIGSKKLKYTIGNFDRQITFDEKILLILSSLILILCILHSLTPVWDYDGLMYHVEMPRIFWQAGHIFAIPDNWLSYYPSAIEMLFMLGVPLGIDSFGKTVHLIFAVLLALSTFSAARHFAERSAGWLSMAILIGIPIYPIWATLAYNDMAWALYEFLALYVVLIWIEQHQAAGSDLSTNRSSKSAVGQRLLILAGIFSGFALGTKYMAASGALALGILVLWIGYRSGGWREMIKVGLIYGMSALFVASPWYLKNWVWTGNPVYPFFFLPGGEIGERVAIWTAYMNGFGAPRTVLGYLMLPVLLYSDHTQFGTFLGSIEIPSLLFPLALIYLFTRRTQALNILGLWTLLRFGFWAVGVQQTRYLLPIFPALSILSAYVLSNLAMKIPGHLGRSLTRGLGFGVLSVSLIYSLIFFVSVQPLKVIVGSESRDEFLNRQLTQYPIITFINNELPQNANILMLCDGRSYYCENHCIPDIDHSFWPCLVQKYGDIDTIDQVLRTRGATHLMIDLDTANFVSRFDRTGLQQSSLAILMKEYLPVYTREIARKGNFVLVELTNR